ncbi:MAG: hypothetical protein IJ419_08760 [Agathobacter sp.]|nr:hypothetical protein [Agathobacter sp.]
MSQLFGMDLFNLNNNRVNQANKKADKVENTKNTIGKPELSETASSYYEELKAKYGDVEFVLVDDEQTENAKEYASNIRSDKSMIVLISESEVEAMATDENTRTKNEQLITDAQAQMPGLIDQLKESGVEVKSFGIELNSDGTTSYFAVVDKSLAAQRERIEKNRTEKQEENAKNEKKVDDKKTDGLRRKEDLTTVSASSMEELIKKIKDTLYEAKADMVMTEQEKMVGQHFDLKF